MNPSEHRAAAERLLDLATRISNRAESDRAALILARAQVHALLALGSDVEAPDRPDGGAS
jgi:hypothetical protein